MWYAKNILESEDVLTSKYINPLLMPKPFIPNTILLKIKINPKKKLDLRMQSLSLSIFINFFRK